MYRLNLPHPYPPSPTELELQMAEAGIQQKRNDKSGNSWLQNKTRRLPIGNKGYEKSKSFDLLGFNL